MSEFNDERIEEIVEDYIEEDERNEQDDMQTDLSVSEGQEDYIEPEFVDNYILVQFQLNTGDQNEYSDDRVTSDMLVQDWRVTKDTAIGMLTVDSGTGKIVVKGTVKQSCYMALMLKGIKTNIVPDSVNTAPKPILPQTKLQFDDDDILVPKDDYEIEQVVKNDLDAKYNDYFVKVTGQVTTNLPSFTIQLEKPTFIGRYTQSFNTVLAYLASNRLYSAVNMRLGSMYENQMSIYDANTLDSGRDVTLYIGTVYYNPDAQDDSEFISDEDEESGFEWGDD